MRKEQVRMLSDRSGSSDRQEQRCLPHLPGGKLEANRDYISSEAVAEFWFSWWVRTRQLQDLFTGFTHAVSSKRPSASWAHEVPSTG